MEERRTSIIDAVLPLLMEHGRAVTTRQIADAAGIAEGTVFRAFGDKETLIEAAVERYLDPAPLQAAILAIDPTLSLEQKIHELLFHLRARMTGVMGIMNAVGMVGQPMTRSSRDGYYHLVEDVLRPDLDQLRVGPERAAQFMRLISFASAIPQFNEGHEISTAELAAFITNGIAGIPAERGSSDAS